MATSTSAQEFRHIVRVAGKDVDGRKKVVAALAELKGVGYNFAYSMLTVLGIDPNMRIGFALDTQIAAIENVLKDPASAGFPRWYLNRQRDIDTGRDMHLLSSDLEFAVKSDIEREKGVMSWRGYRHMYGLKVRGQSTRTTGRKGGTVGVRKGGKAAAPQQQQQAQQQQQK
ncbi:MAG: 30S ribosomal protein S13 [Candidatus Nitrosocaldus sp.]|nr:30S ribosomal protein S13 [Candidatus Nitrosocaldus sp.]MDW8000002.1 30S ribosomal protein S13 [Candidatus Nitrosocaldus sp.]